MIPSENVTIMVHSLACLLTPVIRTATVLAFHIVRLWAICLWVYVLVSVLGIRLRLFGSWCNDRAVEHKWPIGFWCGTAWHADHKRTREPDVFSRNKKHNKSMMSIDFFLSRCDLLTHCSSACACSTTGTCQTADSFFRTSVRKWYL